MTCQSERKLYLDVGIFIICEAPQGIFFLSNPSLTPRRDIMKHIHHLQKKKESATIIVQMRLSVLREIIAKSPVSSPVPRALFPPTGLLTA